MKKIISTIVAAVVVVCATVGLFAYEGSNQVMAEDMGNGTEAEAITVKNSTPFEIRSVQATFDSEETGKSYIVYTDNTTDDDGNVRVYASIFNPKTENMELIPIESDREWKIVETILESIQEENNK